MLSSTQPKAHSVSRSKAIYFLTWRWHFYAGLYVIPFLLILCCSGIVMLFDQEIETARYSDILQVEPGEQLQPVSSQLSAVRDAFPEFTVTQFIPASEPEMANRFSVTSPQGASEFVTVNPYTAEVLGTIDRSHSVYQWANKIHATLLIGDSGDYMLEVAASLGILLLVSGLYLWWPKDNASRASFLKIRLRGGKRIWLRDLHANIGGVLSLALLFFLISGLSWTGIWGKQLVQAWNTFPTYYTWGEKPTSRLMTHADLNHGAEKEMPWTLEQAPVPTSHDHSAMKMAQGFVSEQTISVDDIVEKAEVLGFSHYRIYFPQSNTGVYTLAANSMAGDVSDPRNDRTNHFDQYTGQLLEEVTWDDYNLYAKWMAASVSLHQGDLSPLNKFANLAICLAFIALSVAAVMMWWLRRPQNKGRLGAPPKFASDGVWKTGLITLILLCVLFPLGGLTIAVVLGLDWLAFKRIPALKQAMS
ncbi:PepSY-associated TM helix domain-containing protein [Vibrio olivae]|uniref:PepSY-associated TM helix domain-containing protein n=1 Tax=Vibrio olivae TaxID=1243002 RepID=A0ABV5HNJ7_9VIBR